MNERLKQLAIQCTEVEYVGIDETIHYHYDMEKFAELIVKDCMAMCDELKEEYFNHRKNTMDFDEKHIYAEGESACFNLRYKMKKRFGVGE